MIKVLRYLLLFFILLIASCGDDYLAYRYLKDAKYQQSIEVGQRAWEENRHLLRSNNPTPLYSLMNLGEAYRLDGNYKKALEINQQGLAIVSRIHLPQDHFFTLGFRSNLAATYIALGNYQKALENSLQVWEVAKTSENFGPNHQNTLQIRSNIAAIYEALGDYPTALKIQQEVLKAREGASKPNDSDILGFTRNLSTTYSTLGDYKKALEIDMAVLNQAKRLLRPDHPDIVEHLHNVASSYYNLHDYQKALEFMEQALEAAKNSFKSDHPIIFTCLTNLAAIYYRMGDYQKALEFGQQSWEGKKRTFGPDHPSTLMTLNNLATIYSELKQYQQASEYAQQSFIGFVRKLGLYHPTTAYSASALALISQEINQAESAIFYTRIAIKASQRQRQAHLVMEEELQSSYLATIENRYQTLAVWLIEAKRPEEALEVLRLLKSDEFSDLSVDDTVSGDISVVNDPLMEEVEQLALALREADKISANFVTKENISALSPEENQAKTVAERGLALAEKEMQDFMARLATTLTKKDRLSPYREAGRRNLLALQNIVRTMDNDTVIIHTLSASDKLYLFLTTKNGLTLRQSPVGLKEMEDKVATLQSHLRSRGLDVRDMAHSIYKDVLKPFKDELADVKTIMFSLDGALRYIPMTALYDGEKWLLEKYAVVIFTEAARDELTPQTNFQVQVAGFGLTEAKDGRPALPGVEAELNSIIKLNEEESGILPGVQYLNKQFNRTSLSTAFKDGHEIMHLASHFIFVPQVPNMSYLLLGDGDKLTIMDISQDKEMPFDNVDMLTLSACDTYVGQVRGNGREVEGLATLAQKRGAATVLATLWPIDDTSTGRLMSDFYHLRFNEKLNKAEALRQAQLNLMQGRSMLIEQRRGKATVATAKQWAKETYAHPYYWAPFILMGNWK